MIVAMMRKNNTFNEVGLIDTINDSAAYKSNGKSMFNDFVNKEELFAKSTFPIKLDLLIDRASYVLSPKCSIGTKDSGNAQPKLLNSQLK